jgi:hypothetical protein
LQKIIFVLTFWASNNARCFKMLRASINIAAAPGPAPFAVPAANLQPNR